MCISCGGQSQSLTILHSIFWGRISHWLGQSFGSLTSQQAPGLLPLLHPQGWDYRRNEVRFYESVECLDSDPHPCLASTLLTQLPGPSTVILKGVLARYQHCLSTWVAILLSTRKVCSLYNITSKVSLCCFFFLFKYTTIEEFIAKYSLQRQRVTYLGFLL